MSTETVSKATPGPWFRDRGFRDATLGLTGHTTIDDDFLTIVMESGDPGDNFSHADHAAVYGKNQEANARLIAASPHMFAALEAVALFAMVTHPEWGSVRCSLCGYVNDPEDAGMGRFYHHDVCPIPDVIEARKAALGESDA